mmetsp:Transcript_90520/g.251645  ORF Transcript_90520/g.251645 Transcript_90520/m.251645 type:complete len:202 (+) Transcript_90520:210-815(+)
MRCCSSRPGKTQHRSISKARQCEPTSEHLLSIALRWTEVDFAAFGIACWSASSEASRCSPRHTSRSSSLLCCWRIFSGMCSIRISLTWQISINTLSFSFQRNALARNFSSTWQVGCSDTGPFDASGSDASRRCWAACVSPVERLFGSVSRLLAKHVDGTANAKGLLRSGTLASGGAVGFAISGCCSAAQSSTSQATCANSC